VADAPVAKFGHRVAEGAIVAQGEPFISPDRLAAGGAENGSTTAKMT
jgi:hypothetical protein